MYKIIFDLAYYITPIDYQKLVKQIIISIK